MIFRESYVEWIYALHSGLGEGWKFGIDHRYQASGPKLDYGHTIIFPATIEDHMQCDSQVICMIEFN